MISKKTFTMKKSFSFQIIALILGTGFLASCHKDLDLVPLNDVTSEKVYANPEGYKQALSRVYSAYATTGNDGPAGAPDIPGGGDEGFSDFVRGFWNLQELSTDEAVVAWSDPGLPDIHNGSWSSNNGFIRRTYYRSMFQITLCNEFIRECEASRLDRRGIPAASRAEIAYYAQEARFLRSFQYWVLMDLFGSVPFTTEKDLVGAFLPRQASRAELFTYIESELKSLESSLKPAKSNEYGRADQAAAQALLARLYLNAETYTGTANYDKALEYSSKVIAAGYSLADDYQQMMGADNHLQKTSKEFILTVNYDGLKTKGFGGTHFFNHASVGGDMNARMFGVNTGWAGLRTTRGLSDLFTVGYNGDNGADRRAMFFVVNQQADINNISTFKEGFGVSKYRNVILAEKGISSAISYKTDSITVTLSGHTFRKNDFVKIENADPSDLNGTYQVGFVSAAEPAVFRCKAIRPLSGTGVATSQAKISALLKGNDPDQAFVDIDFPLFRLAEMYLIYAEASKKGASGANVAQAVNYINELRKRAYGNESGNITESELTEDFILAERARELYWEGHRRTDLIRFNRFVEGSYLWPFKGGVSTGVALPNYRKLFPIPVSDLTANPGLKQNPGY
jgi:hypothetical protein